MAPLSSESLQQLALILFGSEAKLRNHDEAVKFMLKDPVFSQYNPRAEHHISSRTELYKVNLARIHRFHQLRTNGTLERELNPEQRMLVQNLSGAIGLHDAMFQPVLRTQLDPQQRAKWLPLSENYLILGCYAQTELGHGSNVQGLETTATFDVNTDEFIIHSPTITSAKYWPGTLGKLATHAAVYARLLLPNATNSGKFKDYGVHGFLVQLRSLTTHEPLSGITLADLGSKIGYNFNDNGIARFDRVRIPREQMFMKYTKVSRDGSYSLPPQSAKLGYSTMLRIRAGMITACGYSLATAVCVALQFGSVRQDFDTGESDEAFRVPLTSHALDQVVFQRVLISLLATSFALHFTGKKMSQQFEQLQKGIAVGDLSNLAEVHTTAAGLKSVCTTACCDGMEEARRACGMQGLAQYSGIIYNLTIQYITIPGEGENTMIIQQLSRYLLKVLNDLQRGRSHAGNVEYIGLWLGRARKYGGNLHQPSSFRDVRVLIEAIEQRTAWMLYDLGVNIAKEISDDRSPSQAYNKNQWQAIQVARAHCWRTILQNFITTVEQIQDKQLSLVMNKLCVLFGNGCIERDLGDYIESGFVNVDSGPTALRQNIADLVQELRPHALNLVSAFNFTEYELKSILTEPNVHQKVLEFAQQSELNQRDVVEGYEEYLKPLLQGEIAKL